jgi:hypothetical protein
MMLGFAIFMISLLLGLNFPFQKGNLGARKDPLKTRVSGFFLGAEAPFMAASP